MLTFHLFGHPEIEVNQEPLGSFRSQKATALLIYLAHTREAWPRETLADLLWDASSTSQALSNLRTVLTYLRRRVDTYIVAEQGTLAFNQESAHWLDTAAFETHLPTIRPPQQLSAMAAARLEKALQLYRGEFLEGFHLRGTPRFNEWVVVERERLHRLALLGYQRLADYYLQQGDYQAGLRTTTRWLALDELNEAAHLQMMRLLAFTGQRAAALEQYEQCRQLLAAELGVAPHAATTKLYEQIERGEWERPTAELSGGRKAARTAPPHNLPMPLTPFIGREQEMGQLAQRLQAGDYRLLTIVGPGGVGKSRLALQTAHRQVAHHFRDGAAFVPLSGIAESTLLMPAIADALNLQVTPGARTPKAQLLDALRPRQMLLLLDNFEHLLNDDEAVELLLEILQGAPEVVLLVTSRERLNVAAEDVFTVRSLPVPPEETSDGAETYEAVQLFADRARRLRKRFVLADVLSEVAEICRLVGGLPLGIELAAAWVRDFACADIATAIAENLDVLATQQRDVPLAHRSLRAVFAYSWALLRAAEQELLARLSVFRGGCTLTAAAAVAGATDQLLTQLVSKSLLHTTDSERYALHEVIRYFAAEKLAAEPEHQEQIQIKHAAYFGRFVQARERALVGLEQQLARAEIGVEMDNVRQGWGWAARHGHSETIKSSYDGLYRYYLSSGRFHEGEQAFRAAAAALAKNNDSHPLVWALQIYQADMLHHLSRFDEALALAETVLVAVISLPSAAELTVRTHLIVGKTAYALARFDQAESHLQAVLDQVSALTLATAAAEAHKWLGRLYRQQGSLERSRHHLLQAVELFRQEEHVLYEIETMGLLGMNAFGAGPVEEALAWYEKALALARQVDNRYHQGRLLTSMAAVYDMQGRHSQTRTALLQALRLAQGLRDGFGEHVARHNLGVLLSRLGRYAEARQQYEQVLRYRRATAEQFGLALALLNYGLLHKHLAQYERALDLHQEALGLIEAGELRSLAGLAWARIGQDREGLGQLAEARTAYEKALAIHQELEQRPWEIEVTAALARLDLAAAKLEEGLERVEAVLGFLAEESLAGAREYFLVHWSCYQVLRAAGDGRAAGFLSQSYRELQTRANHIEEPELRRSYLENVSFHAAITAEQTRLSPREPQ